MESANARATAVAESTRSAIAVVTAEAALDQAERQSQLARSRQLAAQAISELSNGRYEPAILLAIESGHITDTVEAFAAIRTAIANPWHSRVLLQGHTGSVYQATWSNDESKILTRSADNTARIWYVQMSALINAACRWTPRNMSVSEWSLYMEGPYRPTCPTVLLPLDVIDGIYAESRALIQQGKIMSATQPLEQLNGWLQENGQWRSLEITPTMFMLEQASELARSGEITAAVASYQQALRLDPTLPITPEVEANKQYAPTVVKQAAELAQSGEITAAVASYQEALRLDPTLPITPEVEANRNYILGVDDHAVALARSGEITASLAAISQAMQLDPAIAIAGNTWNAICWNGTLTGLAVQVLEVCNKAVAAAPDDGAIHDSRGLARALTGDTKGAIADFEFAVEWAKETGYGEAFITSRQHYVDELKASKNPFTPAELEKLRND